MSKENDYVLITGTSNLQLAKDTAQSLGQEIHETVTSFADGEKRVRIPENLRRKEVFIIQPTCPPVDSTIMELLLMIDAAKRASASELNVVVPYFGYSRQDRKDRSRVPISAALIGRLIEFTGATRILTIDIHSEHSPGFVRIPWDNIYSSYSMLPKLKGKFNFDKLVVASPDKGGVLRATFYADLLNAEGVAIVYKERDVMKKNESRALDIIGNVRGMDVLMVDDMVDTAGTICEAARLIKERGAITVSVCATHGLFSKPAIERIEKSEIDKVYVTDTVPLRADVLNCDKIEVISVAGLLAKAILCIHDGSSISEKLILKQQQS